MPLILRPRMLFSRERRFLQTYLERLAIVDAAIDDLEGVRLVRQLGSRVIEPSIGSHFARAVPAGPTFRGCQQAAGDPLTPVRRIDIPTLQVPHGLRRIATIGVRAKVHLSESDGLTGACAGDKNHQRQEPGSFSRQKKRQFFGMLLSAGRGPKKMKHPGKIVQVRKTSEINADIVQGLRSVSVRGKGKGKKSGARRDNNILLAFNRKSYG